MSYRHIIPTCNLTSGQIFTCHHTVSHLQLSAWGGRGRLAVRSHSSGVLIRREKSRGVLPSSERIITVIVISQIMTQCCSVAVSIWYQIKCYNQSCNKVHCPISPVSPGVLARCRTLRSTPLCFTVNKSWTEASVRVQSSLESSSGREPWHQTGDCRQENRENCEATEKH